MCAHTYIITDTNKHELLYVHCTYSATSRLCFADRWQYFTMMDRILCEQGMILVDY